MAETEGAYHCEFSRRLCFLARGLGLYKARFS